MGSIHWVRGKRIGSGSFGTIHLATPKSYSSRFPPLMVVKSVNSSNSDSLKIEKQIFDRIGECPEIIRCYGDDYSVENHTEFYNLLLEFASKGSLADHMKNSGGKLTEFDVRRYAKSVIKGLCYIHEKGFVHCDIKPENLLVFDDDLIKIADFGLGKKIAEKVIGKDGRNFELRGTPAYMSPEIVNENEYEPPADIWAFGCTVLEMFTGEAAWANCCGLNAFAFLIRIGMSDELPAIPEELSELGKNFLWKIFVRDPKDRWTAEMLLNHPFLDEITEPLKVSDEISSSPKCHFDFGELVLKQSVAESLVDCSDFEIGFGSSGLFGAVTAESRIQKLSSEERPNWSFSSDWVNVR